MDQPSKFMLQPYPLPWLGGEPRVFAVPKEAQFPQQYPSIKEAQLLDVRYQDGGLTTLLNEIASLCGVRFGSFQALLENIEGQTSKKPIVIVIRDADRLLADVGPALIHVITGWEGFTHHASGVSAMYLVLETGSSAVTNSAFFPGGVVDWVHK
jgi:hypothetical protein